MFYFANNKSYAKLTTKAILRVYKMYKKSLQRAVALAGSQTALGKALGKSQAHVWGWINRDGKVPAEYAIQVEKITGVPRYELRPDIYPPEEYKQAS
jgi:DNA-binding transcriptional regulator YdaS (Cro superfamily)